MTRLTAIKKVASIGDLSSLKTENKESIVEAINENADSLNTNKNTLEDNIASIKEVL